MVELTERCESVAQKLFPRDAELVQSLLRVHCGDTLPLVGGAKKPADFDRFRLAVLKLSEGDLAKLDYALKVVREDWRDVLVAAGFGHSVTEHDRWAAALLSNT